MPLVRLRVARGILSSLAVIVFACTSVRAPQVLHQQYQWVATYPLGPFSPGESLHVVWTPRPVQAGASDPYEVRFCIGVFGSYGSVETLKKDQELAGTGRPECPIASAVVGSEVLRTRSDEGRQLEAYLTLPNQPGLYNVLQIVISASPPSYSATTGAGIIEIRGR
jgi:hypothetical protein